ncbi:hypothetical protein GUJ93_ZPchr0016g2562 [Zizania palustris]|uniref:Uncharacterized protein n=1 Tax=Zizania palustris TaxID=103762 RepID=A0A8J5SYZ8_ZIZPA|nr:hypothetical protein GUJ93_ZPchr0016g2562 [Zizania palustris]
MEREIGINAKLDLLLKKMDEAEEMEKMNRADLHAMRLMMECTLLKMKKNMADPEKEKERSLPPPSPTTSTILSTHLVASSNHCSLSSSTMTTTVLSSRNTPKIGFGDATDSSMDYVVAVDSIMVCVVITTEVIAAPHCSLQHATPWHASRGCLHHWPLAIPRPSAPHITVLQATMSVHQI